MKAPFSQVVLRILDLKKYQKFFSWAFVILFVQSCGLVLPYNLKILVHCCDLPSSNASGRLMYSLWNEFRGILYGKDKKEMHKEVLNN